MQDSPNYADFDPVSAPKHYCLRKIPFASVVADWKLDFFLGNVIKYVDRWEAKGGIQDLKKAKKYLEMKIELLEKGELKETIKHA